MLRNKIVGSLGLKTGAPKKTELKPPYHVGQKIGLFHVLAITDDEVVLGEDDKHLDFRVSLFVMKKNTEAVLIVSTLVKTKNLLGVMYFSVVKPIHLVIVPMMVREMAKRIDARPPLADRL